MNETNGEPKAFLLKLGTNINWEKLKLKLENTKAILIAFYIYADKVIKPLKFS